MKQPRHIIPLIFLALLGAAAAPPKSGQGSKAEFNRQLDLLAPQAMNGDPRAAGELAKLEALARQIGEQSSERARLLRILSIVQIQMLWLTEYAFTG